MAHTRSQDIRFNVNALARHKIEEEKRQEAAKEMRERNKKEWATTFRARDRTAKINRGMKLKKVNKDHELKEIIELFYHRLMQDSQLWNAYEQRAHGDATKDIQRRKNHLQLIKDEIHVITKLKELRDISMNDENRDNIADLSSVENVELLSDAREELKKAGIKHNL